MFKVVALLKRRPGMSMDEFKQYYENVHLQLGAPHLKGNAVQHMRRYLTPLPSPVSGEVAEADCDAIMEMWFESREQFEQAMKPFQEPELARQIVDDEANLFDRSKIRMFIAEEHVTDLR